MQGEQIQECRNRLDNTEHEQHELAKTVLDLQARMAAAEQALHIARSSDPNPPGIASKSWHREPDDTLLRISAAHHMAKSEAERVFAAVLVHAKLAQGDGQPPVASLLIHAAFSKNYVFQFSGAAGLGASNCRHVWESLRDAQGEWVKFFGAAANAQRQQVFISLDRTPKQAAVEQMGKIFEKDLKVALPSRHVTFQRRNAKVLIDRVEVAHVKCPERDRYELIVNPDALKQIGVPSETLAEQWRKCLHATMATPGGIRWESCV